jgi:hypothetical protein
MPESDCHSISFGLTVLPFNYATLLAILGPLLCSEIEHCASQFSIAGQVSPLTASSRTALIRLRGPGYDGRHQAAVDQAGFVAATLTLPQLSPGRWYVAIEDLSQVSPSPEGQETGHALLDLAIYDVR